MGSNRINGVKKVTLDNHESRLDGSDRVLEISARESKIQGNNNGPDPDNRKIGFHPLDPVFHKMQDTVSSFDANLYQSMGQLIHPTVKLTVGQTSSVYILRVHFDEAFLIRPLTGTPGQ
jgi:hypothetical protein